MKSTKTPRNSSRACKCPKPRGLAAMDPETKTRICSLGGQAVSKDRGHMANIGAIGGSASQKVRRIAKREAAKVARQK